MTDVPPPPPPEPAAVVFTRDNTCSSNRSAYFNFAELYVKLYQRVSGKIAVNELSLHPPTIWNARYAPSIDFHKWLQNWTDFEDPPLPESHTVKFYERCGNKKSYKYRAISRDEVHTKTLNFVRERYTSTKGRITHPKREMEIIRAAANEALARTGVVEAVAMVEEVAMQDVVPIPLKEPVGSDCAVQEVSMQDAVSTALEDPVGSDCVVKEVAMEDAVGVPAAVKEPDGAVEEVAMQHGVPIALQEPACTDGVVEEVAMQDVVPTALKEPVNTEVVVEEFAMQDAVDLAEVETVEAAAVEEDAVRNAVDLCQSGDDSIGNAAAMELEPEPAETTDAATPPTPPPTPPAALPPLTVGEAQLCRRFHPD